MPSHDKMAAVYSYRNSMLPDYASSQRYLSHLDIREPSTLRTSGVGGRWQLSVPRPQSTPLLDKSQRYYKSLGDLRVETDLRQSHPRLNSEFYQDLYKRYPRAFIRRREAREAGRRLFNPRSRVRFEDEVQYDDRQSVSSVQSVKSERPQTNWDREVGHYLRHGAKPRECLTSPAPSESSSLTALSVKERLRHNTETLNRLLKERAPLVRKRSKSRSRSLDHPKELSEFLQYDSGTDNGSVKSAANYADSKYKSQHRKVLQRRIGRSQNDLDKIRNSVEPRPRRISHRSRKHYTDTCISPRENVSFSTQQSDHLHEVAMSDTELDLDTQSEKESRYARGVSPDSPPDSAIDVDTPSVRSMVSIETPRNQGFDLLHRVPYNRNSVVEIYSDIRDSEDVNGGVSTISYHGSKNARKTNVDHDFNEFHLKPRNYHSSLDVNLNAGHNFNGSTEGEKPLKVKNERDHNMYYNSDHNDLHLNSISSSHTQQRDEEEMQKIVEEFSRRQDYDDEIQDFDSGQGFVQLQNGRISSLTDSPVSSLSTDTLIDSQCGSVDLNQSAGWTGTEGLQTSQPEVEKSFSKETACVSSRNVAQSTSDLVQKVDNSLTELSPMKNVCDDFESFSAGLSGAGSRDELADGATCVMSSTSEDSRKPDEDVDDAVYEELTILPAPDEDFVTDSVSGAEEMGSGFQGRFHAIDAIPKEMQPVRVIDARGKPVKGDHSILQKREEEIEDDSILDEVNLVQLSKGLSHDLLSARGDVCFEDGVDDTDPRVNSPGTKITQSPLQRIPKLTEEERKIAERYRRRRSPSPYYLKQSQPSAGSRFRPQSAPVFSAQNDVVTVVNIPLGSDLGLEDDSSRHYEKLVVEHGKLQNEKEQRFNAGKEMSFSQNESSKKESWKNKLQEDNPQAEESRRREMMQTEENFRADHWMDAKDEHPTGTDERQESSMETESGGEFDEGDYACLRDETGIEKTDSKINSKMKSGAKNDLPLRDAKKEIPVRARSNTPQTAENFCDDYKQVRADDADSEQVIRSKVLQTRSIDIQSLSSEHGKLQDMQRKCLSLESLDSLSSSVTLQSYRSEQVETLQNSPSQQELFHFAAKPSGSGRTKGRYVPSITSPRTRQKKSKLRNLFKSKRGSFDPSENALGDESVQMVRYQQKIVPPSQKIYKHKHSTGGSQNQQSGAPSGNSDPSTQVHPLSGHTHQSVPEFQTSEKIQNGGLPKQDPAEVQILDGSNKSNSVGKGQIDDLDSSSDDYDPDYATVASVKQSNNRSKILTNHRPEYEEESGARGVTPVDVQIGRITPYEASLLASDRQGDENGLTSGATDGIFTAKPVIIHAEVYNQNMSEREANDQLNGDLAGGNLESGTHHYSQNNTPRHSHELPVTSISVESSVDKTKGVPSGRSELNTENNLKVSEADRTSIIEDGKKDLGSKWNSNHNDISDGDLGSDYATIRGTSSSTHAMEEKLSSPTEQEVYSQVQRREDSLPQDVAPHSSEVEVEVVNCVEASLEEEGPPLPERRYQSNLVKSKELSASKLSLRNKMGSIKTAAKGKWKSLRKAVSLERGMDQTGKDNSESKHKSPKDGAVSGGYGPRPAGASGTSKSAPPKILKAPSLKSITSIFGKKKSKKKKTGGESIECETIDQPMTRAPVPVALSQNKKKVSVSSTSLSSVESPTEFRPIGKLLEINYDGSQVIELTKPLDGPVGFFVAKGNSEFKNGFFVSRFADGNPEKLFAGLLGIGDEILEINGHFVRDLSLKAFYALIENERTFTVKVFPFMARRDV